MLLCQVDQLAVLQWGVRRDILVCGPVRSSTLVQRSPVIRLWGMRGRTPKYKLGLYGPHSNESLEARDVSAASVCCSSKIAARQLCKAVHGGNSMALPNFGYSWLYVSARNPMSVEKVVYTCLARSSAELSEAPLDRQRQDTVRIQKRCI